MSESGPDQGVMRTVPVRSLSVPLVLDGRSIDSDTEIIDAGPWTVRLATAIADQRLPVTLHSTYQGAPGSPTLVMHLLCGPGQGESTAGSSEHLHDALPVWHSHGRLLLDHLQVLIDHVSGRHVPLACGELDDALTQVKL